MLVHNLATDAHLGPFSPKLATSTAFKRLVQHAYAGQQLGPEACRNLRHNALRPLAREVVNALAHLAPARSDGNRGCPAGVPGPAYALHQIPGFKLFQGARHGARRQTSVSGQI